MLSKSSRVNERHVFLLIALTISFAMTGIHLANFDLILTRAAFFDDVPITYALVFDQPTQFQADVFSHFYTTGISGSLINSSTALLWHFIHLDPYTMTFFLSGLMVFLLGMSSYWLIMTLTNSQPTALLGIALVYATHPYQWNLSNYSGPYPLVYAATLAITCGLIAFGLLVKGWHWSVLVALLITGLIHPSIGIYASSMVGLYWLWEWWEKRLPFKFLLLMTGTVLLIMLPTGLASFTLHDRVPSAIMLETVLSSGHLNPFPSYTIDRYLTSTVSGLLFWSLLSRRFWLDLPSYAPRLWACVTLGSVILWISHRVGVALKIVMLIQLSGARATVLFSLTALALSLFYCWQHILHSGWLGRLLVALTLLLVAINENISPWLLLAFLLLDLSQGTLFWGKFTPPTYARFAMRVGVVSMISLVSIQLGRENAITWLPHALWNIPQPQTHTTWLVIGAALVTGFGLLSDNATFSKHLRVELIYGCAASLVGISLLLTYVKFTEQMHDLRQEQWILDLQAAQKWARKNTAPDDMFLGTEISWRSIAWRPYLYFDPIWRWYIYLPDQRLLDNQARLRAWYGITPQEDHLVQSNNLFYQFSSQELLSLREQEGVDYLLRRRDLPVEAWGGQLNFAVVYENTTFQLYDLHHPLSDLWDKNDQAVQAEWAGHISDEDGFILDAAGGLNSLRPSMALDYIPQNHRIRKKLIPYGLYEKNYLAAIWQYRSPAPLLHELGIKYVYVDKTWLGDAPAAAQHALQNPSQFEEIFTLQERGLYRVQESVLEVYPPAIMTMDIILRVVNMQLYDDWLTTGIDPNAVILLPRDNLGLGLTDYLAGVRLPEMLDAEAQAAFQHWQTSKLPAELHTAGVDYLLVDHLWWQYLTPAEATLLNDPALYELVKEWQVDGFAAPFYRLYKVR